MVKIRKARLSDVQAIMAVTRDFGQEGIMLPLSVGDTVERICNFIVAELQDGTVVGCAALDPAWDRLVEVRSLAVARQHQRKHIGRQLVEALMDWAREIDAQEMFTLTYVPEFFKTLGFEVIDRNTLPHKVWLVCVKCPKFPDCGEVALKRAL